MRGRESLSVNILRHPAPREGLFRFAALTLCVCLTAAFALFAVLVLSHAHYGHEHDGAGDGCLICALITTTQNSLFWLDSLARLAIFSFFSIFTALCNLKSASTRTCLKTLTALKIQLNR
jgi:hypothetical protein